MRKDTRLSMQQTMAALVDKAFGEYDSGVCVWGGGQGDELRCMHAWRPLSGSGRDSGRQVEIAAGKAFWIDG